jgi:hypothetical protein
MMQPAIGAQFQISPGSSAQQPGITEHGCQGNAAEPTACLPKEFTARSY